MTDVLSRVQTAELMTLALSNTYSDLSQAIVSSWDIDPRLRTLITELVANPNCHK